MVIQMRQKNIKKKYEGMWSPAMIRRPEFKGSDITTPKAAMIMELLGVGIVAKSVALSSDEFRAVKKLYGYQPEEHPLTQAGSDRNVIREAECDGLRLIAWLAKFVPAGEDPLKTLIQIADEAGCNVSYEDISWAMDNKE